MSKHARQIPTPKLRFPEFIGQALSEVQLRDVTAESTSRNGSKLPVTSVMGVTKADGIVPMEERIVASDIGRYKIVEHDWFAYNPMRINIGSIARWRGDGAILVSPDYVVFKCIDNGGAGINPAYLDHFRQSDAWKNFVTEGGDGSVRIRIYYRELARLPLVLPQLAEQQRIADCLTSLDDVITAQRKKVEASKAHKRGLTQRLFPCDGTTSPRLRFPAFRNGPEWRYLQLGSIASKVGSGITPRGGDKNYRTSGRAFVRSQNIGWGQLLLNDVAFLDEDTHNSFNATEIVDSDVLLNITGASIGRSAVADKRVAGGNVNQHVCIIRVKQNELSPTFLNQFLISDRGQRQIDSFQAGGNRQGLNFQQIRSFEIPVPPTREEQRVIAGCLSSLDVQIVAESEKLDVLTEYKSGLMKHLFPTAKGTNP